jgi:hypothetical protein
MARLQVKKTNGSQVIVVEKGSERKIVTHDNRSRKRNTQELAGTQWGRIPG